MQLKKRRPYLWQDSILAESQKESIKYEKSEILYGVCMAIFSHRQQYHSDFRDYIRVERGDQQAKDMLDHISVALVSFTDILSLKFGEKANENSVNFGLEAVKNSINRVISKWEFSIKSEKDLKVLALEEIKKAIAIASEGDKAKLGFERDRKMLESISSEIKNMLDKALDYDTALRILIFLRIEEKDIGSKAEDKHFLDGSIRSAAIGLVHS